MLILVACSKQLGCREVRIRLQEPFDAVVGLEEHVQAIVKQYISYTLVNACDGMQHVHEALHKSLEQWMADGRFEPALRAYDNRFGKRKVLTVLFFLVIWFHDPCR